MKAVLKSLTPRFALHAYRSARGRWDCNDLLLDADSVPGPVVKAFETIKDVPGYFTYDDCVAFSILLQTQTAAGLTGDVLEIGSYCGRSTAILASHLQPSERLVVCDAFESIPGDTYPVIPTPENLRATIRLSAPQLRDEQIDIKAMYSTKLVFPDAQKFRCIHIDGGHSYDVATADLSLSLRHLQPGGVIVLDDYQNPMWPDVTRAADAFRVTHPELRVMADVNRFGDPGRKLYLAR